ncbi:hypothetical protein FKG94_23350 [Exilibacterium tricleocarpae]|uniref:DUF2796 domain-containing protein n=1 Tax=Exilibacterium tricleocarpae TaxID=2591008 RepID=A0A545STE1_9GAMM|nr:hypothetical protein [Exilibacterium tricleocarpae]TQV68237.1 hypothetical protein FKG94_23350 [Exilibacterium tricleocarpae]
MAVQSGAMKPCFTKFLCLVLVLSSSISVFAQAQLHLVHGSENSEETFGDLSIAFHKAVFPHDRYDHTDKSDADHDVEDHASHGHGSAAVDSLKALDVNISNKDSKALGAVSFLADPLYLIDHIPD